MPSSTKRGAGSGAIPHPFAPSTVEDDWQIILNGITYAAVLAAMTGKTSLGPPRASPTATVEEGDASVGRGFWWQEGRNNAVILPFGTGGGECTGRIWGWKPVEPARVGGARTMVGRKGDNKQSLPAYHPYHNVLWIGVPILEFVATLGSVTGQNGEQSGGNLSSSVLLAESITVTDHTAGDGVKIIGNDGGLVAARFDAHGFPLIEAQMSRDDQASGSASNATTCGLLRTRL